MLVAAALEGPVESVVVNIRPIDVISLHRHVIRNGSIVIGMCWNGKWRNKKNGEWENEEWNVRFELDAQVYWDVIVH